MDDAPEGPIEHGLTEQGPTDDHHERPAHPARAMVLLLVGITVLIVLLAVGSL